MNRLDRALGILLLLRQGATVSATALADRFEVSIRTIYRDVEALSELGIPVYAEMGREGGFRLLEGYFLPPVMFAQTEAMSLLLGLTLLRRLRVIPFPADVETAERKLLAALPDALRDVLTKAPQMIGFEALPPDIFHWGPPDQPPPTPTPDAKIYEGQVVGTFLRAIFMGKSVQMHYRSPYKSEGAHYHLLPRGLLWDRDWWYLVGQRLDQGEEVRLWRADRVLNLTEGTAQTTMRADFDVNTVLGRTWLRSAMQQWIAEAPVKVRLTRRQADLLQRDWYYGYAQFEDLPNGQILMTFGEDNPQMALDLLRWLGPGAELIEPHSWRALLRQELIEMLAIYQLG